MANLGSLILKVGSDISGLQQGLQTAQNNIKSFSASATRAGAMMTVGLTAPIVALGTSSLKMAMDAVESENLFKEAMGGMGDSARAWSEDLQKSMGLNGYELRKNIALFNTMTTAAGLTADAAYGLSKDVVELSHDMASFFNVSQADALNDLKAIVTGESEPMKKYGVLMGENTLKAYAYTHSIAKQGAKLTETQKIAARYGVIMQATSKAQGDLARTIDSPSNKLRVLKEQLNLVQIEMGNKLIPVMLNAMLAIQPLVDWLTQLSDAQMTTVVGVLALVAALGPIVTLFGVVGTVVGALLSPFGLVSVAVAGLVLALFGIQPVVDTVKLVLGGLGDFMLNVLVGNFSAAGTSLVTLMNQVFGVDITNSILDFVFMMGEQFNKGFDTAQETTQKGLEVLKSYWDEHGDSITENASTTWSTLVTGTMDGLDSIGKSLSGYLELFAKWWEVNGKAISELVFIMYQGILSLTEDLMGIFLKAWSATWKALGDIFEGATKILLGIFGFFINLLTGNWSAAWDNLKLLAEGFVQFLKGIFGFIGTVLLTMANTVGAVVKNVFEGLFSLIGNFIRNTVNGAIDLINMLITKLNALLSFKLPSWMGGGSVNLPDIPTIQHIGGEPANLSSSVSGNGGNPTVVQSNVYLDGKKISTSVDKHLGTKASMATQ